MSIEAINAVLKLRLPRASHKFVLLCLANYANEELCAYPSIGRLVENTCMDRKTIVTALSSLCDDGLLVDTGERKGTTKQIPVYRIVLNSPENGTVPKTEQNSTVFPSKESRKRDTEPLLTISEPSVGRTGQKSAKEGQVEPLETSDEVLPYPWQVYAETKGFSNERIFQSWERFKDRNCPVPFRLDRWQGWVDRER